MGTIQIRVQPRSSRNRVEVLSDGTVKLWTSAPPVDGQANDAVLKLLSKYLGLPVSSVRILRGESGRTKVVEVDGLDGEVILDRLQEPS